MQIGLINESEMASPLQPPRSVLMQDNEEKLVVEAKGGSAVAFEQLVERYGRKVLRLAQDITRNREDASTRNCTLHSGRES